MSSRFGDICSCCPLPALLGLALVLLNCVLHTSLLLLLVTRVSCLRLETTCIQSHPNSSATRVGVPNLGRGSAAAAANDKFHKGGVRDNAKNDAISTEAAAATVK